MSEKYLSIKDLMDWLSLGKSSIYRRIDDGTLPKPIKIGNLARFKESNVRSALNELHNRR